jgi:hypothetical protein
MQSVSADDKWIFLLPCQFDGRTDTAAVTEKFFATVVLKQFFILRQQSWVTIAIIYSKSDGDHHWLGPEAI